MTPHQDSGVRWFIGALIVVTASALIFNAFETRAAGTSPAATYVRGNLHVWIPYQAPRAGSGRLAIEILSPEDEVLGHAARTVDVQAGKASWEQAIRLDRTLPLEEIVWHRLRYRFTYAGEQDAAVSGIESISAILRTPVIHILGQQSYLAGGQAAVRVIVTDSKNEAIAGSSSLRIDLVTADKKSHQLFAGQLNPRGTAEAQFTFPAALTGSHSLRYAVDTPIGVTEYTQQVRLEDKLSVLLTTEKPIYQPGQTIHVRALALDRSRHEAAAARKLIFEVEDSRGNKVFKKGTQTDRFGISSAEFALADEVNLGTYHLRALMEQAGGGDPSNAAEIALNVERYVLPKFKVAIDFSGENKKEKHGYRPGDHVTGTVRANYFFGKPVDGADITVKASGMDVAMFEAATAQGKTDADGAYKFDLKLPGYFAGRPLDRGSARVLVEATVKDNAAHAETRGEPITVSQWPLILTAVPEGGKLVPDLANQVFVLASYADGKPAVVKLRVQAAGNPDQAATTDAGGVAIVTIKAAHDTRELRVQAEDAEGNSLSTAVPLEAREGADPILLRTERAVYRAGDRISLRVFSTRKQGTAYVDVVKEGQTVLTRDLDIVNGQAELSIPATPDLAGTLDISAYQFGQDSRPAGDHRLVFVQPADELRIEASTGAPVYRPGDEAQIRFRVTNTRGEGVEAALGLQVVDEAVFALAEKQPGFAKVFFYLEQELMKPRYEVHSIGMPEIVEPVPVPMAAQRDRAARALFAATEMVNPNKFETEFGRAVPQTRYADYHGRYYTRFVKQLEGLPRNFAAELKSSGGDLAKAKGLRDAWDTEMQIDPLPWGGQKNMYVIRSAGPDKSLGTGDDMVAYVNVRTRKVANSPSVPPGIEVDIEHDRGPFNGLAEIAGGVADQSGAGIPGASIAARDASSRTISATTRGDGQFTLSGLHPGTYEVQVSAPGFRTVTAKVTLVARDRAVVTATVPVADVTEVIEVTAVDTGVVRGVAGGVPGGVAGGVIGGIVARQNAAMRAMPMAVPAPPPPMARDLAKAANTVTALKKEDAGAAAPRVRSYFPEALYINPRIITDKDGRASITIPLADSITTWRMALMASTVKGALGSAASSIKVFQDFFVDLDLPVTLTQGDRVSIPVAAYNYSGSQGEIELKLQPEEWFTLVQDSPEKTIAVDSGRVGGSQFSIEARRIGKFKLTLNARMKGGAERADIVVREIEVVPDGREQNTVFNGRLETSVRHDVDFPAASIPDASKVFVRLYPGPLSQVVEGMDGLLRMPYGCFEQTSSSTYPNVLALDYMKRTKKLTPEIHAKAEGFIATGYQRLLTFEVPGGGFSWFGQAPANKILTSYGLMEFSDMSKVHEVDSKLIARTQDWLARQQKPDGSWAPDTQFINEGATNRFNTDVLRITAYIGWALTDTGYQGPAVESAKKYVSEHLDAKADSYTLAVIANFAADYAKDREFIKRSLQRLLDAKTEKDEQVWWTAQETAVFATGESANIETTGLAVQALLKSGEASGTAKKALTYIAAKKDASGMWGTTQATIMALRSLLLSTEKGTADVRGTVEITLNGRPVEKLVLTPENNDLLHQFVLKGAAAKNSVEVRFNGSGGLAYQVVGRYFLPWAEKPANELLSIDVQYDRTRLAQDDIATATATVRNNLPKVANMVMVDLGIPPGFDLLSEDLQSMQEQTAGRKGGRLEKFSLTATQAILYFDSIGARETVTVRFRLHAKYPIRARTFQSRVYEYYDPAVSSVARPAQFEVRKK